MMDMSSVSHNYSFSKLSTMEEDCEESLGVSQLTQNTVDINQLFASFLTQMSTHMDRLQAQLQVNDQKIYQAQDSFKQEFRAELDELCLLITNQQLTFLNTKSSTPSIKTSLAPSPVFSGSNILPNLVSIPGASIPSNVPNTSASTPDIQAQMIN
jgi:hypothetical protein